MLATHAAIALIAEDKELSSALRCSAVIVCLLVMANSAVGG
jgi:hypothetical protein